MSKQTAQRVTFAELIAKKQQREHDKFEVKDIYLESMDKKIPCQKPSDEQLLDTLDMIGDNTDIRKTVEAFDLLILKCCNMLNNDELQKDLTDPLDVVRSIFEVNERLELGKKLADWADVDKVVEDVKN